MINESKAYQYCLFALEPNNDKVPKYVKLQCQAWKDIADGNDSEAYISESAYTKVIKILGLMIHPDLLKPLDKSLEDYAMFLITATFCTKYYDVDAEMELRYYETALLKIARKNFKTFNSAVIFILLMLTEPRFSRFFSVAPDLKLSKELQVALHKIIKSSPLLSDELEPVFRTLRSEIRCLLTESEYTPLAYSTDGCDGKLPSAFLADEAGAMDSYPVEAMRSGQITLLNGLCIIISTEYPNDNNVMEDEVDKAKKTLDGLRENKRMFSLLYEPDDYLLQNDQWKTNDLCIYQSNPVTVHNKRIFKKILEKREDAILYENKRENYLCKHNNIKYKSLGVEGYIEITKVRECKQEEDLSWWKGRTVWVGLDLSMSEDNTAVSINTDDGEYIVSKTWGFIPTNKVELKTKKEDFDYKKSIRLENCFSCGDDVIDYSFIENHVLNLESKYGVKIQQIGYDRWNALSSVQKLEAKGYECVEVKQHSSVLHMPTKLLKEKVLSKKFRYDNNLLLENNFQNARCTEDTNKNKYVNKKKSKGKVDMVVSILNGVCLLEIDLLSRGKNFVVQTG